MSLKGHGNHFLTCLDIDQTHNISIEHCIGVKTASGPGQGTRVQEHPSLSVFQGSQVCVPLDDDVDVVRNLSESLVTGPKSFALAVFTDQTVVKVGSDNVPVLVEHVAHVALGPATRRCAPGRR